MMKVLEKRPQRSLCGLFNCGECDYRADGKCIGCLAGNLARRRKEMQTCIIYDCVRDQKIESCLQCYKKDCPLVDGQEPYCVLKEGADCIKGELEDKISLVIRRRAVTLTGSSRSVSSEPRLARARWYLASLDDMAKRGIQRVCSYDLARATGVKSALVRRDLSSLGHLGTPSLGYEVAHLRKSISEAFGLGAACYWIGAAKLAASPSIAEDFQICNYPITAVFDPDATFTGKIIAGYKIKALSEIKDCIQKEGVETAILALPETAAQAALDEMVDAGIRGVLSIVNLPLTAPPHVIVQQADLPSQLFVLLARCRK